MHMGCVQSDARLRYIYLLIADGFYNTAEGRRESVKAVDISNYEGQIVKWERNRWEINRFFFNFQIKSAKNWILSFI